MELTMSVKNLSHLSKNSFFSKAQEDTQHKERPLALEFSEKMFEVPKMQGQTFNATVNITPKGDSSADVNYDWTG
jgi:hypothetical protein